LIIDPRQAGHQNVYKLLIGAVVPRPIVFVSTFSRENPQSRAVQFLYRRERQSASDLLLSGAQTRDWYFARFIPSATPQADQQ